MRTVTLVLAAAMLGAGCKKPPEPATPDTVAGTPDGGAVDTTPEPEPEPDRGLTPEQVARRTADAVAQLTVGTPEAARRAQGILDEIARKEPGNAYVWFNLGVAHDQLGEAAQAETAYEKAISLDASLARAYLGLGVLLEKAGRTNEAVTWYRKGVEADSEDMDLRSALIGGLRRKGRLDDAISEARAALAFNSKSLPVYNDLGLVYIDKGDLSMARFVYLKALSQVEGSKNNASIRTNFGRTLYLLGERLQARKQLEESYALDKTYLPTLVYLSGLYMDDRNYADAVPLLEEALRQEPDNVGVVMNLGIAYRGIGRLEDAKRLYERALELQPDAPEPHRNLGILYGDYFKDYDAAIASFDTYLARGGSEEELVASYKEDVEKERKRAEHDKEREAERKKREQEKLERQRLLEQAEREAGQSGGDATPQENPEGGAEGGEAGDPWSQQ